VVVVAEQDVVVAVEIEYLVVVVVEVVVEVAFVVVVVVVVFVAKKTAIRSVWIRFLYFSIRIVFIYLRSQS